jgi:hypothetical protein
MASGRFRVLVSLVAVPSALLLFLRVNPFQGIIVFTHLLAAVTPLVALAVAWRVSRPDMGYFRWFPWNPRGLLVIILDLFAVAVSIWVGWGMV